jgi:hypothetical protein
MTVSDRFTIAQILNPVPEAAEAETSFPPPVETPISRPGR